MEPASLSMKLLFFMGFLMGLVTFTGFSANILSTLTSIKSLNTFKELVEYREMPLLGSAFAPWQTELKRSKYPVIQSAYKRISQGRDFLIEF